MWREKYDRDHKHFLDWKNYDEWEPTSPWPEDYNEWTWDAKKNPL